VAPLTNVAPFGATFQVTDLKKQISILVTVKDQKWTGRSFRLLFTEG
jgi:hypothetical protein